ncbi:Eco57I restriction-modification methylase domain-containing protein [Lactobacillus gasseri]
MSKEFKFDVVIGNPPYQDNNISDTNKAPSIYPYFIDEAYKVGRIVELIHPARFLFNAGDTSKKWNKKMLMDPHLKVSYY